ncbi:MAG: hypothetical protein S4CHLAM2_01260 [Chlamydiales bacterium]|nr:hypothetical protein [Chlamydiales bacterium]
MISSLVSSSQTCVAPPRWPACIGAVTLVALAVIAGLSLGGIIPSGIAFFTCLPLTLIFTGTVLAHLCTREIQAPPRTPETARSSPSSITDEWRRVNIYLLAVCNQNTRFDQSPYQIKSEVEACVIGTGANESALRTRLIEMQVTLLRLLTQDNNAPATESLPQARERLTRLWTVQQSEERKREAPYQPIKNALRDLQTESSQNLQAWVNGAPRPERSSSALSEIRDLTHELVTAIQARHPTDPPQALLDRITSALVRTEEDQDLLGMQARLQALKAEFTAP